MHHRTLAASNVSHTYGTAWVLRDVCAELRSGQIRALVGQNGSGKSTLINVLTGSVRPTEGRVLLDGREVSFHSTAAALRAGVAVVHQHYHLFPDLSVADNVVGAHARPPRRLGLIDRRAVAERVAELFAQLEMRISPSTLAGRLDSAERKFVEIARALLPEPSFLILDEPTASMQPDESSRVLELIERVKARGVGLAFVSHRIPEVLAVADAVTILRDGRVVAEHETGATEAQLAAGIVGPQRELELAAGNDAPRPPLDRSRTQIAFSAPGVGAIAVAPGEILGMAGLVGSGASATVKRLGGLGGDGWVEVEGERVACSSPRAAARHGIGFIPEDRTIRGVIADMSVGLNIALGSLERVSHAGVVDRRRIDEQAMEYQRRLSIAMPSVHAPARALSGGNQQKVLISRWLASGVQVLAIDEPTHGVDIGGKAQIHQMLREFAADGGAVVVAGAEPEELVALCDRVAVFVHGRVTHLLARDDLETGSDMTSAARLLEAMFGGAQQREKAA
jgi:ABC-type sugar transport system ATPase subunit